MNTVYQLTVSRDPSLVRRLTYDFAEWKISSGVRKGLTRIRRQPLST
jgi:hypothetical protein